MKQLAAALRKCLLRFDIIIKDLTLEWPVKNKTPWKIVTLAAMTMTASNAQATETTTYTYDALGRLIQSKSLGTVNNGLQTDTAFDPAGNRSNQTVTGSVNNSPPVRAVIVLPLNGYTIIPLS